MNNLMALHEFGQSFWYDNIRRKYLLDGTLQKLIDEDGLRGVTSNPSIFEKAIGGSQDYDNQIKELVSSGADTPGIYEALALEDIRMACDLFAPLYRSSDGQDGFVSLEVSPLLANDEEKTVPFADALGVGAGLIDLPPGRSSTAEVTIHLELERLAIDGAGGSSPNRVAALVVTAPVGTAVDRRLGSEYRVRFDLLPGSTGADPMLENFTLSRLPNAPQDPLINADLRPIGDRPIVLGVPVGESGPTQLRLHLATSSTEDH